MREHTQRERERERNSRGRAATAQKTADGDDAGGEIEGHRCGGGEERGREIAKEAAAEAERSHCWRG